MGITGENFYYPIYTTAVVDLYKLFVSFLLNYYKGIFGNNLLLRILLLNKAIIIFKSLTRLLNLRIVQRGKNILFRKKKTSQQKLTILLYFFQNNGYTNVVKFHINMIQFTCMY